MDGWSPLGASKEVSKSKRNGADLSKSNRKVYCTYWGLHNQKYGKVCPQLPPIFPRFHSVKRRHRGRHCGSNPLQSGGNEHPLLCLLCGTNNLSSHSPDTISSTITEILFLLRRKCPYANIHLFPILPRLDYL